VRRVLHPKGVAAISLGLVGQEALAERLGRNQRFAAIGGLTAAGIMGVIGYLLSTANIFLVTAEFGVPVILSLVRIRADDIHFGRSCCAADHHATHPQRVNRTVLFKDRRLLTFAICTVLPQATAYAMIRRRAAAAGIAAKLGNHSFRATGITAYIASRHPFFCMPTGSPRGPKTVRC
jgi:hypothetical protein